MEGVDVNSLTEEELHQLAVAYLMDEDFNESDEEGQGQAAAKDSDVDELDFNNFKGIYFNDDPNRKYQDPDTGCHFEYKDLCKRLVDLKALRKEIDKELGLPITPEGAPVLEQKGKEVQKRIPAVIKIQRNKIKEHVPGILDQNKQVPLAVVAQPIEQQQISKSNIQLDQQQAYQNNQNQVTRSKSMEKHQILQAPLPPPVALQQLSFRGHHQRSNVLSMNQQQQMQMLQQNLHRKQASHEEMVRGSSQGGLRKSLRNDGSKVTISSGTKRNRATENRRTIEGKSLQLQSSQIDEIVNAVRQGKARQSSIYIDQINNNQRQFKSSNFSSSNQANPTSVKARQPQSKMAQNYNLNLEQLKQQILAIGTIGTRNGASITNKTFYGQSSTSAQRKSRNSAGGFAIPNSLSMNFGQQQQHTRDEEVHKNMSPYFVKQKPVNLSINPSFQPIYKKGDVSRNAKPLYSQQATHELLQSVHRNSNIIQTTTNRGLPTTQGDHLRKSYGQPPTQLPATITSRPYTGQKHSRQGAMALINHTSASQVFPQQQSNKSRQQRIGLGSLTQQQAEYQNIGYYINQQHKR
ncbi:hypothetical protein FGO68_gene1146 [Halteria grandinella]|uniref:Uncharacterized protein n=1 Tax=Halteria grandinella TaxID=5974 RepID=A0A8J8NE33_HALGN|nr:hypothetical protein FGO68_gene1146 [Halteria grandinella]